MMESDGGNVMTNKSPRSYGLKQTNDALRR
jgi:hypothetical protein